MWVPWTCVDELILNLTMPAYSGPQTWFRAFCFVPYVSKGPWLFFVFSGGGGLFACGIGVRCVFCSGWLFVCSHSGEWSSKRHTSRRCDTRINLRYPKKQKKVIPLSKRTAQNKTHEIHVLQGWAGLILSLKRARQNTSMVLHLTSFSFSTSWDYMKVYSFCLI